MICLEKSYQINFWKVPNQDDLLPAIQFALLRSELESPLANNKLLEHILEMDYMPIGEFVFYQKFFHSVVEKILKMKLENLKLNEEEK